MNPGAIDRNTQEGNQMELTSKLIKKAAWIYDTLNGVVDNINYCFSIQVKFEINH